MKRTFFRTSLSLLVPPVPTVSADTWLKEHTVSTRVEMDHLEPVCLDAGDKFASQRSTLGNSFSTSDTFTGGEDPRSERTKANLADKCMMIQLSR